LGKVPVKGWLDLHLTIAASHSALIINDVANATIDGNPGFALVRNNGAKKFSIYIYLGG